MSGVIAIGFGFGRPLRVRIGADGAAGGTGAASGAGIVAGGVGDGRRLLGAVSVAAGGGADLVTTGAGAIGVAAGVVAARRSGVLHPIAIRRKQTVPVMKSRVILATWLSLQLLVRQRLTTSYRSTQDSCEPLASGTL